MKIGYDAAFPNPNGIPGTQVVCIYAGGDTPHVWTDAEINEQPEQYRLPIFVRSNPTQCDPHVDASAFMAWLLAHNVPSGAVVSLDLETAVDPAYVQTFETLLYNDGHPVLPYGSRSSLFQNPQGGGYFVADPGATGLYVEPGKLVVATQYAYDGSYDLSFFADSLVLWQHPNPPTPAPAPVPAPPAPTPVPRPTPAPVPAYPLPANQWYGQPNPSPLNHSGYFWLADRPGIAVLQTRLRALGYGISVDGKFGPQTYAAVVDFQRRHGGLVVDGRVGPLTWAALWS